jgi:hypothetical protein
MKLMTDKAIVDWMEERADDLSIHRDKSGTKVILSFCSTRAGCPVDVEAPTVREAVEKALRADRPWK